MSVLIRLEEIAPMISSAAQNIVLHLHASLYLFGFSCICFAGNDDCCPGAAAQSFDNWLQFPIICACEQSYKKLMVIM